AADRRRRGARGGRAPSAPGAVPRARARDERRVLLRDRLGRGGDPAAARAGHVRVLARRRLVGAHPRAEADGTALPALGALRRPGAPVAPAGLTLAEAAAGAGALAERGAQRAVGQLAARGDGR